MWWSQRNALRPRQARQPRQSSNDSIAMTHVSEIQESCTDNHKNWHINRNRDKSEHTISNEVLFLELHRGIQQIYWFSRFWANDWPDFLGPIVIWLPRRISLDLLNAPMLCCGLNMSTRRQFLICLRSRDPRRTVAKGSSNDLRHPRLAIFLSSHSRLGALSMQSLNKAKLRYCQQYAVLKHTNWMRFTLPSWMADAYYEDIFLGSSRSCILTSIRLFYLSVDQ